jgi:HSP20 family molecular chaperone IbpA
VRVEPRQQEDDAGRKHLEREHLGLPMARVFELLMDIDTDNVHARIDNGILRIYARKAIAARRRVIQIEQ